MSASDRQHIIRAAFWGALIGAAITAWHSSFLVWALYALLTASIFALGMWINVALDRRTRRRKRRAKVVYLRDYQTKQKESV
jgi:4-hydroxybenzoate polyprenyltransferase